MSKAAAVFNALRGVKAWLYSADWSHSWFVIEDDNCARWWKVTREGTVTVNDRRPSPNFSPLGLKEVPVPDWFVSNEQ